MRCPFCHSYIPENNPPLQACLACGQSLTATPNPVQPTQNPVQPTQNSETTSKAFAPFFTIRSTFTFSLIQNPSLNPALGSISFGPQGFSIVWSEGKNWEKFYYRDLHSVKLLHEGAYLEVRNSEHSLLENILVFYHPWLPHWIKSVQKKRSQIFLELLSRVKTGLTPFEIQSYQQKLQ